MTKVYLLLGSNLNEPSLQLAIARKLLAEQAGIIVAESHEYRSAPWGVINQPDFLNQVLCIQTSFSPLELLTCLQQIELKMGRERIVKWGSRIIDIDILYYEREIIIHPELKIPHPEIQNRRFTLIPLCDIAPEFIHPVCNVSNTTLLNRCTDNGEVNQL